MKNNVELYINGNKVDLSDSARILFTYRIKDIYNPTIVKNSFSKTLTLEGTKNNNQIFNNLYNLNVAYSDGSIQNFNSSKRNPFELFMNGELIETGYIKLDSIKKTGKNISYNCTLYGGLGDFLYNLMYSSTGDKKTLASLDYGTSLDFTINRSTVQAAWQKLNGASTASTDNAKWDVINFMPAYNGIGDTMDCEHIIVNTNGYSGAMREWSGDTWVDIDGFPTMLGEGYKLRNGFALVTLPKPMTEWQVRDLRSYMQRPVVSMKQIIQAITNKDNNGGYEVVLDSDFFNVSNPYYQNAWVTLPLLNELKNKEVIEEGVNITRIYTDNARVVNTYANRNYYFDTQTIISTASNLALFNCKFRIQKTNETSWGGSGVQLTSSTASMSAQITGTEPSNYSYGQITGKHYCGYALQLVGLDDNNKVVAQSNKYWLTSYISNQADYLTASEAGIDTATANVQTEVGDFSRYNSTTYEWPTTLSFTLDMANVNIYRLAIKLERVQAIDKVVKKTNAWYGSTLFDNKNLTVSNYTSHYGRYTLFGDSTTGYKPTFADSDLTIQTGGEDIPIYSNSPVTKNMLLTTEYTPADYLISFAKLFNLYFEKDVFDKKVYIKTMKNYYDNEQINLQDKIDRDKEINITPLAFNTNTYEMEYKIKDQSEVEEKYFAKYGSDFGSQKIVTGYDFDGEKKEIYDGIFVNAATTLEAGRFYTMAQVDENNEIPTFLYATVTYQLFNSEGETSECRLSKQKGVNETALNVKSLNSESGLTSPFYDAFPKVQFHNEYEPLEGANVLVFFNGFKEPYRAQYQPFYTLSDDIQQMISWCEKPCYLYSQGTQDANRQTICSKITNLPQFSRYITTDATDTIHYSLDIGRTKELYIPDLKYLSADSTIYERYWSRYLEDLYDIDTRIVECYVRFDEKIMADALKHYYYFDDSYWVISEIIDYNPDSSDVVKVKFVKVNEFGVYTDYNPAELPSGITVFTITPSVVNSGATTVTGYVWVESGTEWLITAYSDGLTPSVFRGTGSSQFSIAVSENPTLNTREMFMRVYAGYYAEATVTQYGADSESMFRITPYGVYQYNNIPQSGGTLFVNVLSTYPWTASTNVGYISFNHNTGTGNTNGGEEINITWSENNSYQKRSATIVFTNSIGRTITLAKEQDAIEYDKYYTYTYPATGGTFTISGLTSGGIVETKPDWITVAQTGGTYVLTAPANDGSERNGDTIIIMPTQGNPRVRIQTSQDAATSGTSFSVFPTSIDYNNDGGTNYFTIDNPELHNWRITIDYITTGTSGWLSVSQLSGSEGAIVGLTCENIVSQIQRMAIVKVVDYNTGIEYDIYVTQYSGEINPSLSATPSTIAVSSAGTTTGVTLDYIKRNGDFVIATPSSTAVTVGNIEFTGETANVEITVAPNQYITSQTYTVLFEGATVSATVTITQDAAEPFLNVVPTSVEFNHSGGTTTITITSNDDWTIN